MGGFFRFLAFLLLLAVVAIGIGAAVYNAGVTAGLDEAALQARPRPATRCRCRHTATATARTGTARGGWGIFGILFLIFGIFLCHRARCGPRSAGADGAAPRRTRRLGRMAAARREQDRGDASRAAPARGAERRTQAAAAPERRRVAMPSPWRAS